jgi:hypothetical protein
MPLAQPSLCPPGLRPLTPEACEALSGGAVRMSVISLKALLPRFGTDAAVTPSTSDPGGSTTTNIGSIGTSLVSVGAIYL